MARRKASGDPPAQSGAVCPQEARWNQIEFAGSPFARALNAAWRSAGRDERARINAAFPELLSGLVRNNPGVGIDIPA